MGLAMRSAQLAAEALIGSVRCGRAVDVVALRSAYAALWRGRAVMCRLAAQVVSRPGVAAPALDLLSCVPSLRRAAVRLIGK
jgi:flavin-dependent dehydrogenase